SSAYCEYDLITVPTSKEQIARMRDYWRSFKREDQLERFIVSEQSAKEHGMSVKWWGKGQSERRESLPLDPTTEQTKVLLTFDGQIERMLSDERPASSGFVYTAEGHGWYNDHKPGPFTMCYRFASKPLSELVAKGPRFR